MSYQPKTKDIDLASNRLKDVVLHTPLNLNSNVSNEHQASIYLKREDLQVVRSYKLRGAYNKMSSLNPSELDKGIVCASAGNHAQGVAYSCNRMQVKGIIFMPSTTPKQKIEQVRMFGDEYIDLKIVGDTFDECALEAKAYCKQNNLAFIHPFDDEKIIEGQGTIAAEILNDFKEPIDYLFFPIGGGGLAAGITSYFKEKSPQTKLIGVEPAGAPSMKQSIEKGERVMLKSIDKFVDGAAVQQVGELNFEICRKLLDDVVVVNEGKVCTTILKLYNKDAIVVEPAGALALSALDQYHDQIKGKNVVCIVSGSNNDITRTEEIRERSMLDRGLLHYFVVKFPQRAGALRQFLTEVLGPNDDIIHFEYSKKNSRVHGPAVVGIELKKPEHFDSLYKRMKEEGFLSDYLNENQELFQYLV